MYIAPSVLAADFANLHNEMKRVGTADYIHLDVMDGHFVPNISFGFPVIKGIRKSTEVPFDVHLMISHPLQYLDNCKDAGADVVSFHVECDDDANEVIDRMIELGLKPAVAVKPGTDIESIFPFIEKYGEKLYMVLVMTVEPGFGGQKFMPDMMNKVKALKAKYPELLVEVDGGVNEETIDTCREAGVDICVAGTAVFGAEDPADAIAKLR
ncbi:MAG: ribulose-phosphate 3-epimerase [Clostridia bacterium]|nr:ribulose-phosphate 3-epimerase [Clostridia bacterium]